MVWNADKPGVLQSPLWVASIDIPYVSLTRTDRHASTQAGAMVYTSHSIDTWLADLRVQDAAHKFLDVDCGAFSDCFITAPVMVRGCR